MKLSRTATAGLIAAAALTACNTPDALVPPMEIGDGGQPVSESDLSQNNSQTAYSEPSYSSQSPVLAAQGYAPQPQNSLEAQAAALASGQANPVASPPLSDGSSTVESYPQAPAATQQLAPAEGPLMPPPGAEESETADTQQPTQQAPLDQDAGQQTAPAQSAHAQSTIAALPPAGAAGTIRFLPIIGAPVQSITPLSRQLGAEARAKGLTIKGASDPASEHILKGYFSAFGDGKTVTIVYVWDVLDSGGNRLHRIQGEEKVASAATDPWVGVPASLMQQIATKTMGEYTAWRQSRRG